MLYIINFYRLSSKRVRQLLLVALNSAKDISGTFGETDDDWIDNVEDSDIDQATVNI